MSSWRRLELWAISMHAANVFTYAKFFVVLKLMSLLGELLWIALASKNRIADLKFLPFNYRLYSAGSSNYLYSVLNYNISHVI